MATVRLPGEIGSAGIAAVHELPPRATPAWYTHRLNRAAVYRAGALVAALPRRTRLGLAVALAPTLARRLRAEHAAATASIDRIAAHAPAPVRAALVDELFRNFAVCFVDLVTTNRRPRAAARLLGRVEGEAHLEAATRSGRGLLALTAHVGNWELGGRLLAARLARRAHVLVAAEADPGVERFLRGGNGALRFVVRTDPTVALPLLAALRRGEVVAMQGDRALGTRGDVAVPFFGADAWFPLGPFVLARAARALVLPCFCLLDRDRRYSVVVGEPIVVAPGSEPAALARWVAELERLVAAHPEQWFNFFDVWRAVPAR